MTKEASEVLHELSRRGVRITAEDGMLVLKPRELLDDTIIQRVKACKPAIVKHLVTCQGCYSVGEYNGAERFLHPHDPAASSANGWPNGNRKQNPNEAEHPGTFYKPMGSP